MIYIIMSSIIILAIMFFLFGVFTVTEDTKNKTNDKPTPDDGGDDLPVVADIIEPTPIKPTIKRAPRKATTKGSIQPSVKRAKPAVKKRVAKKVAVKK